MAHLARQAVKDIGYDQAGFSWRDAEISIYLHAQSADIAAGVDAAGNKDEGAGDPQAAKGKLENVSRETFCR